MLSKLNYRNQLASWFCSIAGQHLPYICAAEVKVIGTAGEIFKRLIDGFLHNLLPELYEGFLNALVCLPINTTTWHFVFAKDQRTNVNPAVMADICWFSFEGNRLFQWLWRPLANSSIWLKASPIWLPLTAPPQHWLCQSVCWRLSSTFIFPLPGTFIT